MNPAVFNREKLNGLDPNITIALDKIVAAVVAGWGIEHRANDKHGNVNADSLIVAKDTTRGATGAVTITGPVTITADVSFTGTVSVVGSVVVTGAITTTGAITSSASFINAFLGYYERGRTKAVGEWDDFTFAAGNFTATVGAWTLTAPDQLLYRYQLIGKTLKISFRFDTTTVTAGTAGLRVKLPLGLVAVKDGFSGSLIYNDNGAGFSGGGHIYATAGLNYVEFHTINLAAWNIAANTTYVWGQMDIEI